MKRIPKKNIEDTSLTMNCLSVMEDVEILDEMPFPYRRNELYDVLENGLKCFMENNNFELCFGAVYSYVEALERLMPKVIHERISHASLKLISKRKCINTFMNDIYEWAEWFYRYNVRKETSAPVDVSEDVSEVAPVDNVSSTDKGNQILDLRRFFYDAPVNEFNKDVDKYYKDFLKEIEGQSDSDIAKKYKQYVNAAKARKLAHGNSTERFKKKALYDALQSKKLITTVWATFKNYL